MPGVILDRLRRSPGTLPATVNASTKTMLFILDKQR
jgi:hypothetical protein